MLENCRQLRFLAGQSENENQELGILERVKEALTEVCGPYHYEVYKSRGGIWSVLFNIHFCLFLLLYFRVTVYNLYPPNKNPHPHPAPP